MPGFDKTSDFVALDSSAATTAVSCLPTAEFLAHLRNLGAELRTKDGRLLLNAPAGALTAELQNQIRQRKPEILALLLADDAAEEDDVAPLTFAQQRLWLIDRFSPGTPAYNIPQSWTVNIEIDRGALQQALLRLAERHTALRTCIEMRDGEAVQVILKQVEIPVAFTDLSDEVNEEKRNLQLRELLVSEGRKAIPLSQAPLIRFHVIRLAPSLSVFSYNMHHIIADQWSLDLLKRELAAFYTEIVTERAANLRPLSLQYSDIARRERTQTSTDLHARQLDYWRRRLLGMPMLLELPFSKSRSAEQTYAGATCTIKFDPALTSQLRQFAARSNTSLYFLMLTAFAALVYRYTGQKDFCFGTPITGRKRREEEDIIGLFVNMLPLRCTFEPTAGFHELIKQISGAVLDDFENSDIPFQKLVMELHPQRSQAYSSIFQIMFALNPRASDAEEQQETFIGVSKFDLSLQIAEQADTLDAHFEFRTDLFEQKQIESFGRHFVRLAESLIHAPDHAIATLPILTHEDLAVIRASNATDLSFDRSQTLISLFERQVMATPQSLALCCGDAIWSYRELNNRANTLAAALQADGAGPGVFVAICLDRTPELIAAILGVLKSGAAYLPLDPKYPEERLAYMLKDSGARVMIADHSPLAQKLSEKIPGLLVVSSSETYQTSNPDHVALPDQQNARRPEDAAYLIYTSGSTGRPKGVVVEQRNAVALIAWAISYFDAPSLRGMLASTSVCFDLSIFEIFLPLATGNTIILVHDVLELPKSVHSGKVTLINTVPSAMSAVLQTGLPPTVRTVCMAGEFLPTELVDRVYAAGAEQVIDLYGPTETTTYSTVALRVAGASATIGGPIANTRIYLLDENLMQVPVGALGEILIGGEGVTRGYLNQPELTAEKFILRPSVELHGRLYRTGDLARQLEDGSLVYQGRRDQQIKLRGHRIELGEIEAALRDATGASHLAVVVQKRDAGDTLAAFLVESMPGTFDAIQCVAALRRRLPAYMIPSHFFPLAALPLTPNGKIDRKALSATVEPEITHASEAPRDLLEQWLANICAFRLGRKQIARNAHFFDELGGHSLVAFEIFADIEKHLGAAMMLATLFQAPAVESLAVVVGRRAWKQPKHIRFVHAGSADDVLYLIGREAEEQSQRLRKSDQRVMSIALESIESELEEVLSEIASIERNCPSLVIVFAPHVQYAAHKLALSLAPLGFTDVSVRAHE
jgi:amino acid adenylation domain-containing protein